MSNKAVISFYNTPSGLFRWWDQFPKLITSKLSNYGVDHIAYYKDYTENTTYPSNSRNIATNQDLNNLRWLFKHLAPICRNYKQVIIHTHSHYPPLKLWAFLLFNRSCQWHITEHRIGSGQPSRAKRQLRILLRNIGLFPRYIIGVSHGVRSRCINLYGKKNVKTIYNGIDLSSFQGQHQTESNNSDTTLRVLYVGRMDHKKGVNEILEAFHLLDKEQANATLTMVGSGRSLDSLKQYCQNFNLESRIKFAGYQSDVKTYYESHDLIIVPTQISEALSLVAIEARAMGLPVIYAKSGGLPEVFEDNHSGIGLDDPTPANIAKAVKQLVENRALLNELSGRTQLNIEKFDIATMTDAYVKHYISVFEAMP